MKAVATVLTCIQVAQRPVPCWRDPRSELQPMWLMIPRPHHKEKLATHNVEKTVYPQAAA